MSSHLKSLTVEHFRVERPMISPLVLDQSVAGADALTINMTGAVAAGSALAINDAATGVSVTNLIDIGIAATAGRTTGHILALANLADGFIGDAINISLGGASVTQQAMVVTDGGTGANTQSMVLLNNTNNVRATGHLMLIQNVGTAFIGDALRIIVRGGSVGERGLAVFDQGDGVNASHLVFLSSENATRTGNILRVTNTAGLWAGTMVGLYLAGSGLTQQALIIQDDGTGANTAGLVGIVNANAARTTGALLAMLNLQTAFIGPMIHVQLGGNSIAQQALVIVEDGAGVNTNPMVSVTYGSANATGGGISVTTGAPATNPTLVVNTTAIYVNAGAPDNANGADQDLYFRTDGAAGTKIYGKFAGAWADLC